MNHPFSWISRRRQRPALIAACGAAIVLMGALMVADRPLRTAAAPDGIVSFELAGTAAAAGRILDSWEPTARVAAGFSLGLDYLFLVVYAAAIAMACGLAADRLAPSHPAISRLGKTLAWAQWVAAACDMAENLLLIMILQGAAAAAMPAWARVFALVKFGIVGTGLLYAGIAGIGVRFANRPTAGRTDGGI